MKYAFFAAVVMLAILITYFISIMLGDVPLPPQFNFLAVATPLLVVVAAAGWLVFIRLIAKQPTALSFVLMLGFMSLSLMLWAIVRFGA